MDERYTLLLNWLGDQLPDADFTVTPASEDASFRRYFRVRLKEVTRIVMDAPPAQEDSRPFVIIADALRALGLQTPRVFAADYEQGFLLLSDLGERQYLQALSENTVEQLYNDALDVLLRLQTGGDPHSPLLPRYDRDLLLRELEIFREWFLGRHLGLSLNADEQRMLDNLFATLADQALAQPPVWVHRDFHSRNLMFTAENNPGVLDFQGAVIGPLTYDLVSLLRDCYIAWPPWQVERWALAYRDKLLDRGFQSVAEPTTFLRAFDIMGMQRHLKAIGIFARLNIRDGKPHYLSAIPRTLTYVMEVVGRYPELDAFGAWLMGRGITPAKLKSDA
ncbi:MAG: phosphotransferase [Gammaproteobacteria bacterium]|nr:phosphotransferase [Gammaproteobacteria bacterium]MCP5458596.1 phosphotransferase [Gammaproteobacteria bacterium]